VDENVMELNHRLSTLDSAFLYLEKPEAPLHIGGTSIFDGQISFEEVVQHIGDRLHLVPRYLQKVVADPFNLGHPTWETHENFDISQHIFHIKNKKKITQNDLMAHAGRVLSGVMDRSKPLWEIHIVGNIEGNRSAMITKIHHCMVDGISGVDLMKILFDISPKSSPPPPKPEPKEAAKPKDASQVFLESLMGSMQEGMNRFVELQNGLLQLTQTFARNPEMLGAIPHMAANLPAITTPAPVLPFNKPCGGERRLAWTEFSFAEARAIRGNLKGSVNDVVLTILVMAISRYSEMHSVEIGEKIVRFMMPVSLRQKEQRGALGNLISILPVEIPLDIKDPLKLFTVVNQKTGMMKATQMASGLGMLGAAFGIMPAPVQAALGAIANLPFPVFNTIATNVPGPQVAMYMNGKRMIAQYPYVPIGYNLGMGTAIFSYDGKLFFGIGSDTQAMDDVEKFREILDECYLELREMAGVEAIDLQVMSAKS
jgi:diacylglycerol O-acyltransferase / wax synthase